MTYLVIDKLSGEVKQKIISSERPYIEDDRELVELKSDIIEDLYNYKIIDRKLVKKFTEEEAADLQIRVNNPMTIKIAQLENTLDNKLEKDKV